MVLMNEIDETKLPKKEENKESKADFWKTLAKVFIFIAIALLIVSIIGAQYEKKYHALKSDVENLKGKCVCGFANITYYCDNMESGMAQNTFTLPNS